MQNIIESINKKSQELFLKVLDYKGNDRNYADENFLETINLYPTYDKIENSVVVIGINPSATDLDSGSRVAPCYLHSIPEELVKQFEKENLKYLKSWGAGKNHKKLCYPRYFGHIYPLFNQTEYYPLYASKEYNTNWLKQYTKLNYPPLEDKEISLINRLGNPEIRKFILLQDLLPFKETKSNKIIDLFSIQDIQTLIIEILELKFKLFKPKCVIQHWKGINSNLRDMLSEISPKDGFISTRFIPSRNKNSKEFKYELKLKINEILGQKYNEDSLSEKWKYIKI